MNGQAGITWYNKKFGLMSTYYGNGPLRLPCVKLISALSSPVRGKVFQTAADTHTSGLDMHELK